MTLLVEGKLLNIEDTKATFLCVNGHTVVKEYHRTLQDHNKVALELKMVSEQWKNGCYLKCQECFQDSFVGKRKCLYCDGKGILVIGFDTETLEFIERSCPHCEGVGRLL
jgi:hypothetical protein